VTAAHEATHHAGAHASKSNHTELHLSLLVNFRKNAFQHSLIV
jgi:hypothetical protein